MKAKRHSYQGTLDDDEGSKNGRDKRPSYKWETHLSRASSDGVVKPLRSCLKKSSSQDLRSPKAVRDVRGHASPPCLLDDESESTRGLELRRIRRPSKTLSLDIDSAFVAGMRNSSSNTSLASAASGASTEGQDRSIRRQRRRRASRIKNPGIMKPLKPELQGILRSSSEPVDYKPKKRVSFSDLDRCRWNSQGSSLNLNKSVSTKAFVSDGPKGAANGNFVWEKKTESSVRQVMRSESLSGIYGLLKQEANRQAPSRPARRGSNEKKPLGKQRASFNAIPRRRSEQKSVATANVFRSSVSDFQASVRSSLSANTLSGVCAAAPSMPRRSTSMDDSSSECVDTTKKNHAPRLPSRNISPQRPRANNPFQAQVNDFQASLRTSLLVNRVAP